MQCQRTSPGRAALLASHHPAHCQGAAPVPAALFALHHLAHRQGAAPVELALFASCSLAHCQEHCQCRACPNRSAAALSAEDAVRKAKMKLEADRRAQLAAAVVEAAAREQASTAVLAAELATQEELRQVSHTLNTCPSSLIRWPEVEVCSGAEWKGRLSDRHTGATFSGSRVIDYTSNKQAWWPRRAAGWGAGGGRAGSGAKLSLARGGLWKWGLVVR